MCCGAPRRPRSAPVVVATDSEAIFACVEKAGGRAVMTRADHVSGSDRIFEALASADPEAPLQYRGQRAGRPADASTPPTSAPRSRRLPIRRSTSPRWRPRSCGREERTNPNVVKVVGSPIAPKRLRALYFTRATAPAGRGPLYHHIGLYAYRRAALERFVALPPSPLELRERLEQLRALEAGMRIDVAIVDSVPLGVDTPGRPRAGARACSVADPVDEGSGMRVPERP